MTARCALLMAIIFGWIIIMPPFIAAYNTAKHVQAVEQRLAIQPQLEPALGRRDHRCSSSIAQRHLHPGASQPDLDRAGGAAVPSLPVDPSIPPATPGPPMS